jgi:hypothetical protein
MFSGWAQSEPSTNATLAENGARRGRSFFRKSSNAADSRRIVQPQRTGIIEPKACRNRARGWLPVADNTEKTPQR